MNSRDIIFRMDYIRVWNRFFYNNLQTILWWYDYNVYYNDDFGFSHDYI